MLKLELDAEKADWFCGPCCPAVAPSAACSQIQVSGGLQRPTNSRGDANDGIPLSGTHKLPVPRAERP